MTVGVDALLGSFRESRQDYLADWRLLDDVLYRVYTEHPNHETMEAINAKLYLIGRSYATGIERLVNVDEARRNEQSAAMNQLARHYWQQRDLIDGAISALPASCRDLCCEDDVRGAVTAHRTLCEIVQRA
jgi:hypothetical protein